MACVCDHDYPRRPCYCTALCGRPCRTPQRVAKLEAEVWRLQRLLADAERLIVAHHSSAIHRAAPGDICQVCAGEHEAVQAIWRELHQPDAAHEKARP